MTSRTVRAWSRQSRPPLPRVDRPGARRPGPLAGLHVVLVGADASPHVTGFARFSTGLAELIESRQGRVQTIATVTEDFRADLIVAVTPGQGSAAAVEIAERHDVPLLVVAQGATRPARPSGGAVGETLTARLEHVLAARADRWAVTGDAAHRHLVQDGVPADRIDRLPYWQPTEPLPDHAAARAELEWEDPIAVGAATGEVIVVCPVGADVAAVPVLLATAEVLQQRGSRARLLVTGRGGRLRMLRDATPAGGWAVHEVTSEEYPAAFAAADLILLATRDVTGHSDSSDDSGGDSTGDPALAGRIATAIATGRPLVAALTGTAAGAELDAVDRACVQVRADSPEQLAGALEVLADSAELRAQLAAEARTYARHLLDPARAADALESSVAAVLAGGGR